MLDRDEIMDQIFDASQYDKKSLSQKALKLAEECGELAQAVLSYCEAPGCGYKAKTKEDVVEEAWDCIITAGSIIYQVENGNVSHRSMDVLKEKIAKWIEKSK